MNKQEVIRKMYEAGLNCKQLKYASQFDKGYNNGIAYAINLLDKLDEPEKPVVPKFVADFYESINHDFEYEVYDLCVKFHCSSEKLSREIQEWFNESESKPIQTLVAMHKYGYEVEKEKLYTVKFANEDFGKIYIGIRRTANKLGFSALPMNDRYSKCYFTESELKELKFWDNPAFETNEVEE